MRIIICLFIVFFACAKEETYKSYSLWENYFIVNDYNTHMYIRSLSITENEVLIMSAFKRIDFIQDYAGIFAFDSNKINEIDSAHFNILDLKLNELEGTNGEKYWYSEDIIIKCDTNKQLYETWFANTCINNMKSSKLMIDEYGNIWEASDNGIHKFDGQNWINYLEGNVFWGVCFDSQNNLYASTLPDMDEPGIIFKYNYKTWDTLMICSNDAEWVPCMHFDNNNNLWFGIISRWAVGPELGNGIFEFNGENYNNYNISNSKLPSNSVVDIAIDKDNNIWIGMYGGGIAKLSTDNKWKLFNEKNAPLPFNSIEHIIVDEKDNIWMSIEFYGLSRMIE